MKNFSIFSFIDIRKRLFSLALIILLPLNIIGCDDCDNNNENNEIEEGSANGIAIFGYDEDNKRYFTQHMNSKLGAELTHGNWTKDWPLMTSFSVGGEQYVMGHGNESEGRYSWFIQKIYPSGDIGMQTDSGSWGSSYETLIPLHRVGGRVFIFGQDSDDGHWFVQEVLPGGILAEHSSDHGTWTHFYKAITPLPLDQKTCFFAQAENNHWIIECITAEGNLYDEDEGNWEHFWPTVVSYRSGGRDLPFRTQETLYQGALVYSENSRYWSHGGGNRQWRVENYYATMTSVKPDMAYLIGHNTNKHYFFQHVTATGKMGVETDNGDWNNYYDYLLPFPFDIDYLNCDNWMSHLSDTIGTRTLNEIALPGSHDAGMNSDDVDCPFLIPSGKTVTQSYDIAGQLDRGSRFFDIRPVLDEGMTGAENWSTGHYTFVNGLGLVGCNGESKDSIVHSLNNFFINDRHKKELVILKVTHCGCQDYANDYKCTEDQKKEIAKDLRHLLDSHLVKCSDDCNPLDMTVNDILIKGNIILVAQDIRDRPDGIFQWGYGSDGDYFTYDEFSNTNEYNTMKDDQIEKLLTKENHTDHDNPAFLLSWTLTLSAGDQALVWKSIIGLAAQTTPYLFEEMSKLVENKKMTKTLFPNILYVDDFASNVTRTAIYLNKSYADLYE